MVRQLFTYAAVGGLLRFLPAARAEGNVVVESLAQVPEGWTRLSDADPAQMIRLRISLRQPNLGLFEQTLYAVSSPSSPRYGKHLKRDELRDIMKPHEASTAAVLEWLDNAGIPQTLVDDDSDWVNVATTVRNASALLSAEFAVYGQDGTEVKKVRALKYSVPERVREHITMVAPVIRFGQAKSLRSVIDSIQRAESSIQASDIPNPDLNVAACNRTLTPECLRALYKVGSYQATPTNQSLFGIAGYLEQYAKYNMLEKFQSTYAPYTLDANFSVVSVNGGLNDQASKADSVEANLDIQYGLAMSYKTNIAYYTTGGRGPLVPELDQPDPNDISNEPYLDFLEFMTKLPDSELPQTLTTSYGEDEQSVPREFAIKVCNMFGELGVRGVSVFFSSGDDGPGRSCQTNDGKNTTRFLPTFPAACPYVTAVGGTRYVAPETAAALAGGGFSDIFARPRYQDAAVSKYLGILGGRWAGLYNPAGRGFPDIAAQAYSYHVFDSGDDLLVGGTSASSPVVAGIFSLLNSARLRAGLPPMGFVNPWLYETGFQGLTDITLGGSRGCTGKARTGLPSPKVPYASWNATEGWDPVTGLGTPLFDKLLELSSPGVHMAKIGES
ncbi:hypothetical protein RB595_002965 [Gaeumannomyces hyphopodioides]